MASPDYRPSPLFVSIATLAAALGVAHTTVWEWVRSGRVRAVSFHPQLHYSDDRPRKTDRSYWRIELDSVYELLEEAYAGSPVPPAIKAKLASLGKSPKGPSSK